MQVQVNTGEHIQGDQLLADRVNAMLEQKLARFFPRLTRIEVHLSDVNADKAGDQDKRCALEARPEGAEPIAVTHDDHNLEQAIRGACDKLKTRLDTVFGKQRPY